MVIDDMRALKNTLAVLLVAIVIIAPPRVEGTTFSNTASITLNDANTNPQATPYPSNITVSGLTGTINHVAVTLKNITYNFSSDIDVLLVSPGGQKYVFFANVGTDAGATSVTGANNVTVTLDDSSATTYTQNTTLDHAAGSVTFKPVFTTLGNAGEGDTYTSPAPAAPYAKAA